MLLEKVRAALSLATPPTPRWPLLLGLLEALLRSGRGLNERAMSTLQTTRRNRASAFLDFFDLSSAEDIMRWPIRIRKTQWSHTYSLNWCTETSMHQHSFPYTWVHMFREIRSDQSLCSARFDYLSKASIDRMPFCRINHILLTVDQSNQALRHSSQLRGRQSISGSSQRHIQSSSSRSINQRRTTNGSFSRTD